MRYANSKMKELLILVLLGFAILLLSGASNVAGCYARLSRMEVIRRSELIAEGRFLDTNKSRSYVRFKVESILKGIPPAGDTIAVHIWQDYMGSRMTVEHGKRFLLFLTGRKDVAVNVRRSFDSSEISVLPLYGTIPFETYRLHNERNQQEVQALKWLIQGAETEDKDERMTEYEEGLANKSETIRREAKLAIAHEIIEEIERLESAEEKEKEYFQELIKSDNEYFNIRAIRFLGKQESKMALPLLLQKFSKMDSKDRSFRVCLEALSNYESADVANVLIAKLKDVGKDPHLCYDIMTVVGILRGYSDVIRKQAFEDAVSEIAEEVKRILKGVNEYPRNGPVHFLVRIFELSEEPWSTKFPLDLHQEISREGRGGANSRSYHWNTWQERGQLCYSFFVGAASRQRTCRGRIGGLRKNRRKSCDHGTDGVHRKS